MGELNKKAIERVRKEFPTAVESKKGNYHQYQYQ